jgi:hypothetical protein
VELIGGCAGIITTAGIAGDIYHSQQACAPAVITEEYSMPNALDDAMMMSYNWNIGMDERLNWPGDDDIPF